MGDGQEVTVTFDPQNLISSPSVDVCTNYKEIPLRCSCDIVCMRMGQTDNLETLGLQPHLSPAWRQKYASKHIALAKITP